MQIHELNNFIGTPGASDYFATDNGTDTSKISAANLYAPLNARIDNIIAGPASSAEEVIDARLGANGVTYPSLGDAIRTQVSDLKDEISYVENVQTVTVNGEYTEGKSLSSVGVLNSNAKRIATEHYMPISGYASIHYTVADGYRINICTYSASSEASNLTADYWLTGSGTVSINPSANYMRICIASVGDATALTVSDADKASISLATKLYDILSDAVYFKGALTSGTDLNNVLNYGIYSIANNLSITNAPDGFTGGSLAVIPGYGTNKLQMLMSSLNKNIWLRYYTGTHIWSGWNAVYRNPTELISDTKWLAVGDSIAYGVYSYWSGGSVYNGVTNNCWVKLLANACDYDLTVMASRGMGYTITGQDPLDDTQPRITLDTLLTRIEALTDDFNLITMAFGINDYNSTTPTLADITASLDDAIERLVTKFPNARLIVITPFNECRYGDASTNYAYNYSRGSKTLKELADAIQARCEYYGVECLYASNGFLFNNFNLAELEPDTVHPSAIGHRLIAKKMTSYLQ